MRRITAFLATVAVGLVFAGGAWANEFTDVIDAFDRDNGDPFDLNVSVGYERFYKAGVIKREAWQDEIQPHSWDYYAYRDMAEYKQVQQLLNLELDIGLFKDISLRARLPIIMSDTRELTRKAMAGATPRSCSPSPSSPRAQRHRLLRRGSLVGHPGPGAGRHQARLDDLRGGALRRGRGDQGRVQRLQQLLQHQRRHQPRAQRAGLRHPAVQALRGDGSLLRAGGPHRLVQGRGQLHHRRQRGRPDKYHAPHRRHPRLRHRDRPVGGQGELPEVRHRLGVTGKYHSEGREITALYDALGMSPYFTGEDYYPDFDGDGVASDQERRADLAWTGATDVETTRRSTATSS